MVLGPGHHSLRTCLNLEQAGMTILGAEDRARPSMSLSLDHCPSHDDRDGERHDASEEGPDTQKERRKDRRTAAHTLRVMRVTAPGVSLQGIPVALLLFFTCFSVYNLITNFVLPYHQIWTLSPHRSRPASAWTARVQA